MVRAFLTLTRKPLHDSDVYFAEHVGIGANVDITWRYAALLRAAN